MYLPKVCTHNCILYWMKFESTVWDKPRTESLEKIFYFKTSKSLKKLTINELSQPLFQALSLSTKH